MGFKNNSTAFHWTPADLRALKEQLANEGLSEAQAVDILQILKHFHLPPMSFNEVMSMAYTIHVQMYEEQASQLKLDFEETQEAQKEVPPRLAHFALLLIPKRNREHLVGDLEEEFRTTVLPHHGRVLARCWYFEQVMLAIGFYLWPTIKKILSLSMLYKLIGR